MFIPKHTEIAIGINLLFSLSICQPPPLPALLSQLKIRVANFCFKVALFGLKTERSDHRCAALGLLQAGKADLRPVTSHPHAQSFWMGHKVGGKAKGVSWEMLHLCPTAKGGCGAEGDGKILRQLNGLHPIKGKLGSGNSARYGDQTTGQTFPGDRQMGWPHTAAASE